MHPILRIGLLLGRLQAVESRKKFQKIIHILQVMKAPFPERFDFHIYGAYSSELRAELDAFAAEKLVEEEECTPGTYTIRPTGQLAELVAEAPQLPAPRWLEWADELNTRKPRELEGISTVLYFHQHRWDPSVWAAKFQQLKPHLTPDFEHYRSEALRLLALAG